MSMERAEPGSSEGGLRDRRGFEALVENAPDIIARFDRSLRVSYINPAVRFATGRRPEEYLGKTNRSFDEEQDRDPRVAAVRSHWNGVLRRVFETGREVIDEIEVPSPSGPRWYQSRLVPEFADDGSVESVITVSRDVTEQVRIQRRLVGLARELQHKSATLDAILDNLAEGIMALDLEGRVIFANPSARRMLGVGNEEPLEEPPNPFGDFDLPGAIGLCAGEKRRVEAVVGGGEGYLRIRAHPLGEFDDHRGGVLVVMEDLSEGCRLEADRQRFLSIAAHEIKTPLTTILGASELLLGEGDPDPHLVRRFVGHIHSEAGRARELSDTLLRLAKVGHDGRRPNLEAVRSLEVARGAASRMEPLARGAGIELRVEGEGGLVCADRRWLEQVLLILLDNAIKHSERGGTVRVYAGGGSLSVEDGGSGIDPADLPRVFEPFYTSGSSRRGPEGAGLGLAVGRNLVERMGGRISLQSGEGSGTTVTVELPEAGGGTAL